MSVDPLQSPSEGTGDDALPVEALKEASKRLSFSTGAVVDKKESEKSNNLVDVFLRLRPKTGEETKETLIPVAEDEIVAYAPSKSHGFKMGERETKFTFSKVFPMQTKQGDIFDTVGTPLVANVLRGEHSLLFAYGITNAGKTYTIQGNSENPGILPRALQNIFSRAGSVESEDGEISISVSYLEIYNERIYDLFAEPPRNKWETRKVLGLKEVKGRVVVNGLKKLRVNNATEALQRAQEGLQNRAVAETSLNADSSRSHSIFTIYVHGLKGNKRPGRYSIVDLAGSERGDRTNARGSRANEANKINSSLMHLIHCVRQMRWNQTHPNAQRIVPFRETRLTRLFQESFVGNRSGKIVMIVNASTEADDFDETLHVLKNASLARSVCVTKKSKVNSWRSMASIQKYGLDGRRRKRPAENAEEGAEKDGKRKKKSLEQNAPCATSSAENITTHVPPPAPSIAAPMPQIPNEEDLRVIAEKDSLIAELRNQITSLQFELVSTESEIRDEMAQDFQDRLEAVEEECRERHERQIKSLEEKYRRKLSLARMSDIGQGRESHAGNNDDELECLDDQIAECEEEMTRMRERHEADLAKLTSQHDIALKESSDKIERLEQDALFKKTTQSSEVGTLKTQLQLAMQDVAHKVQAMKEAQEHLATVETENAQLRAREEDLKQMLHSSNKSIERMAQEHKTQIEHLTAAQRDMEAKLVEHSKHAETMSEKQSTIAELKFNHDQVLTQLADLKSKCSNMEKENTVLKQELDEMRVKLTLANNEKEEAGLALQSVVEEEKMVANELQNIKAQLETEKKERSEFESAEKARFDSCVAEKDQEIKDFTELLKEVEETRETERAELQANVESLSTEKALLKSELSKRTVEISESTKLLMDMSKTHEEEIASLKANLEHVTKSKIAIEENHNMHLSHETKSLQEQLETQQKTVHALHTQLMEENEKFLEVTETKDSAISEYEKRLMASDERIGALEIELKNCHQKITQLKERMKELTELRAFNDKQKIQDVENKSVDVVSKKNSSRRKKLSDINPGTVINVGSGNPSSDSEPQKKSATPRMSTESEKSKSNSKQFARTVKGSFRGFKSLLSRSATKPSSLSKQNDASPPLARRTRAARRGSQIDR